MNPVDAARSTFKQPVISDRDINTMISRLQPIQCTDKQYTDRLNEKENIDKNEVKPNYGLLMLNRPPIRQETLRVQRPVTCNCCDEVFGWTKGSVFCSFCGKYSCSSCIPKSRFLPIMRNFEEPLEICMNCELQLLEFMNLNRFYSQVKKIKTAFTRLADEQVKLQTLIEFEKQKSISMNADLNKANDVVAKGIKIQKQRQKNSEVKGQIEELKSKIQKAKEVHSTLHSQYSSKKSSLGRKQSILSISGMAIDEDEELQPPRPQQSQPVSQHMQINESLVNSILQRTTSVQKIEDQQYRHRCDCILI